MKNDYLIIIPAYNEACHIKFLLINMLPYKENVIIIDDGSDDNTQEQVSDLGFRCIRNDKNLGIAACISRGIKYAVDKGIEKVLLMDADGQHNPAYIPEFLKKLDDCSFVFGCRYYKGSLAPTSKWASNLFAAGLFAELTGKYFTDISCGFKGFHITKELQTAIQNANGYSVVFEIVNYAVRIGARIAIVPIDVIYYYNELLYTKNSEIIAFLDAMDSYKNSCGLQLTWDKQHILEKIRHAITCRRDFYAKVMNIEYWAFRVREDGYLFQMNPKDISVWLERDKERGSMRILHQ